MYIQIIIIIIICSSNPSYKVVQQLLQTSCRYYISICTIKEVLAPNGITLTMIFTYIAPKLRCIHGIIYTFVNTRKESLICKPLVRHCWHLRTIFLGHLFYHLQPKNVSDRKLFVLFSTVAWAPRCSSHDDKSLPTPASGHSWVKERTIDQYERHRLVMRCISSLWSPLRFNLPFESNTLHVDMECLLNWFSEIVSFFQEKHLLIRLFSYDSDLNMNIHWISNHNYITKNKQLCSNWQNRSLHVSSKTWIVSITLKNTRVHEMEHIRITHALPKSSFKGNIFLIGLLV